MTGEAFKLEIRHARPEDRDTILAFCVHTWEDGDYIDQAWDRWLADERGPLLVGLLDGDPVALEKVTLSSPEEVWLEGMRVDPLHRGKRIASILFHYALSWARERGVRIVRLATASNNAAVHRMVVAVGLEHVYSCLYYVGEGLAEGEPPELLPMEAADEVWAGLRRWCGLERSHGLYMNGWAWQPLTAEQLVGHLRAGEVWGLREGQDLLAVAIAEMVDDGDEGLVVGLLDGTASALPRLALALRVVAQRCTPAKVEIVPREEAELLGFLEEAGYQRGWDSNFWIFEGSLQDWR